MSKLSTSMVIAAVCSTCLILPDCRPAGEAPPPETGASESPAAETAAPAPAPPAPPPPPPPVFLASKTWGPATKAYTACPSSLCETPAAQAAKGQIRGCAPDTVSDLETLPQPIEVTGARNDCRAFYQKSRPRSPRGRTRGGVRRPSKRTNGGSGGLDALLDSGLGGAGSARPRRAPAPRVARQPRPAAPSPSPQARPSPSPSSPSRPAPATPAEAARTADRLIVIPADSTGGGEQQATQGTLRARGADGDLVGEFPLQHTEVTAEITGYVARTVVEQQYGNPFSEVIEAVYVFPLPGMAAVNDFIMDVRDRRIVGLIRPREEAERIYAEARARGQTASLLTQERPNIFTQNVANIEPGGEVTIRITFFERLPYEAGRYQWVFPMVVGPRYIPGSPQPAGGGGGGQSGGQTGGQTGAPASPPGGGGTSPPTDQVPDADRISPPVLRPGERSGHDIGLTVTLDAGLPVQDLVSAAHCVEVAEHGEERRVVRLLESDSIPNRDFVLRWTVAGAETQFGVLAHRGERGGFLTLMMQPPLEPTDEQVTPREITFIIDVSGSMSGLPLGIARALVGRSLDQLRPDDRFNIFFFASGNGQLWPRARPNNRRNVAAAREFLGALCGGGGTEMLAGVQRALRAEHEAQYLQMFVFLTDGYIGNEEQIFRTIREERGPARFFAFGIGSSVNRHLIEGVGQVGGGASSVVLPRDPAQAGRAVQRFFDMIDSPVLVDVRIDWNGLPVTDQYPTELPDLFAGQTITAVARYSEPASGTAFIEARVGARQLRVPIEVVLPEAEPANAALAPIWARSRIAELSTQMLDAQTPDARDELRRQITDVALEFRLVSDFTAFVAVDSSRVVGDGRPMRVMQPVEMPDGVSYEGVFGEQPAGEAVEVPAWGLILRVSTSGRVGVVAVAPNGPADAAGVRPGAVVTRVDGTLVHDVQHFEGLVLQGGAQIRLTLEPGGEVTLPGPGGPPPGS